MQAAQTMAVYRSSIGKKAIMALTGLIGVGFVLFHMYGNLKVFQGPEYFNLYAEGLRSIGAPIFSHTHLLWVGRIVLLLAVVLHVWAAVSLTRQARKARTSKYAVTRRVHADYASITMRYGGTVLFFFILFHLMHFTWGVSAVHSDFIPGDAYHNVVSGFQFLPSVIVYLIAVTALGFHLYHGTWSMFQTLGLLNRKYDRPVRLLGLALALVIAVGFSLVPLGVTFGLVQ
jgi:succinate dehydrogenase / fumarate reductase cytochrome b subunit